jgi:putative ABC transport system permease protein
VLLRYPAILAALVASSVILAITSAAGPLFVSSAGSAILRGELDRGSTWEAGLKVVAYGRLGGTVTGDPTLSGQDLLGERDAFLRGATDGIQGLQPAVLTILGSEVTVSPPGPGGASASARLLFRTGYRSHIEVVGGGEAAGVWIAESTAAAAGVGPGDTITIALPERTADVPVGGVYRDLALLPPSDFWSPLSRYIRSPEAGGAPPPAFLLADREMFEDVGARLGELDQFTWHFPVVGSGLSLRQAEELAGRLRAVGSQVEHPSDERVEALFSGATQSTALPEVVARAEDTLAAIRGPVDAMSLAGRLVALAVMGAVGVYGLRRRRTEVGLLAARGVGPFSIGGRATVESLVPVAVGAAGGWFGAVWLVRSLGPGALEDTTAMGAAMWQVGWAALAALALLAVVAGVTAREDTEIEEGPGRLRELLSRTPWELVVLVLAAASLYEILLRGDAETAAPGATRVDVLVLLFPILFVAGWAGLSTRVLSRLLPRLRARSERWPTSVYLASQRLAAASRIVLLLVTGSAVAVGMLVYGGTLASSARATAEAKALVTTGSDVRAELAEPPAAPPDLPFPATEVLRVERAFILPTQERVEVLAVDPDTFPRAAFWEDDFGPEPLEDLLARLTRPGSERLPVLVAGGTVPPEATMESFSLRIPIDPVGEVDAFPGMPSARTLLIVGRAGLEEALREIGASAKDIRGRFELWARGSADEVSEALAAAGVPVTAVVSADRVRETTSFLAVSWVFALLQALGLVAGLIAVVSLVLYLQARQDERVVSYALASKMGLPPRSHAVSLVLEISGLLLTAFVIGAGLAVLAARVVRSSIDLMPEVPTPTLLRVPVPLLAGSAASVLLVALLGAWRVHRATARANVAEVMRLAG